MIDAVRGERIALPDGIRPALITIRDGRIASIDPVDSPAGGNVFDARRLLVMPGLVDTHVHINDPGRAEWEGFEHATRSAAAGGVTTLVDMPLNSVPATTDVPALEAKRRAASGRCLVDVAFWGGVVPGNTASLQPLADSGVCGFKCFLSPSGVDEFPHVTESDLRDAMPVVARTRLPLLAHSEWPALLRDPRAPTDGRPVDPRRYSTWLQSRPPESEHAAIELLIRFARESGAAVHVVHLASADAVPMLSSARADGVPITVETCPHYLTFAAEEIPDASPAYKCAPPVRGRRHRDGLWEALAAGVIDFVATDHSPAPPEVKRIDEGDFVRAWGGIASLQLGLAATWTGASARDLPVDRLPAWLSHRPARLAGLAGKKGSIAPGKDADMVVWDPDQEFVVDPLKLFHRHPVTPYAGLRLRGVVRTTILRGEVIFDEGAHKGEPVGELLARSSA